MKRVLVLIPVFVASCSSPFKGLQKKEFTYTANNQAHSVAVLVPSGYTKEKSGLDSAGNNEQVYYYKNGSSLYFARLADTLKEYGTINKTNNIPRPQLYGGIFYKGLDTTGYWREVRSDYYRFGYRNVSKAEEIKFDSVLNYPRLLTPKS